jgi:hypothetical protein
MARSVLRATVGGLTGFIVAAVAYVSAMMQIGSLLRDKYGEGDLGHSDWPDEALAFVCFAWLGLPVALGVGTMVGVRLSRASPKDGVST